MRVLHDHDGGGDAGQAAGHNRDSAGPVQVSEQYVRSQRAQSTNQAGEGEARGARPDAEVFDSYAVRYVDCHLRLGGADDHHLGALGGQVSTDADNDAGNGTIVEGVHEHGDAQRGCAVVQLPPASAIRPRGPGSPRRDQARHPIPWCRSSRVTPLANCHLVSIPLE